MIAPARTAAFAVLQSVGSGKTDLASALARERTRLPDERDRALAGEIATGTLRLQGAFDHIIASFAGRPLRKLDPEVIDILRLTIFQLLHLDRVPASAAVKDAVDMAGKAGKRSASGLVNALLRRVARERGKLPLPERPSNRDDRAAALAYLSITLSHPEWLVARWLDRHGFDEAESWARFNNEPASLVLRANRLKVTRDELAQALAAAGIETEAASRATDALIVRRGNPVGTPLHDDGLFFIQDEASQLVGDFAEARAGERILDACASPGGKTLIMAASAGPTGSIVATDVRARRIDLLAETVRRSGATNVHVVQADAGAGLPFAGRFDRVLLDAPCSGLGTIRRDPDIKWRRKEDDLPRLAQGQLAMLEHAAAVLAEGGHLVYSTCSSEPEENELVVEQFLRRHPDFRADGESFRTLPFRDGLEAFYGAMLVKTKDLR
ncbi:MAG TPA: 16S rRNA (cytosine(967)-C(5))-methyltransferase RsmB [Vicinamibacterales bacterium]|nr:16S rRNA (cytosine(967)-C(5))-methyltransferase RsmB [Vicinamibacterales bacterium]